MATDTLTAVLQAVRTRLLTFDGNAVADALGRSPAGAGSDGRLYLDQAPDAIANDDDGTYRYGVLRMLDWREQGDDGGFARRAQVELHLFARPRSQAATLKAIADDCERALRAWVDVTAGPIVAQRGMTRATVTYEAPADREVVLERLVIPLYVHPQYHTQDSA